MFRSKTRQKIFLNLGNAVEIDPVFLVRGTANDVRRTMFCAVPVLSYLVNGDLNMNVTTLSAYQLTINMENLASGYLKETARN